ncbi:MAG: DUF5989 family protein [Gallionella sp.]|nr:DUF5989 family protein [Gallionella sp.]
MLELIKELWVFIRTGKRYWLAPIILILLLLGSLVVYVQGSALAPFIYALF